MSIIEPLYYTQEAIHNSNNKFKNVPSFKPSHIKPLDNRTNNTFNLNHFLGSKSSFHSQTNRIELRLVGFDQVFKLSLRVMNNGDFLSPNISYLNKNNRYSFNSNYNKQYYSINDFNHNNNNCFYVGYVDDDPSSFAHINLCQSDQLVSFKDGQKVAFSKSSSLLDQFDGKSLKN